MTHRQFVAWQEWLRQRWNEPALTCHYLMNLDASVRRGYAKDPKAVTAEQGRLKFKFKRKQVGGGAGSGTDPEFRRHQKALWLGRAMVRSKVKPTVTEVRPDEVEPFDFSPDPPQQ